jgi:hypothetical protein
MIAAGEKGFRHVPLAALERSYIRCPCRGRPTATPALGFPLFDPNRRAPGKLAAYNSLRKQLQVKRPLRSEQQHVSGIRETGTMEDAET